MTSESDPVQIGKLIQAVDTLTTEVNTLRQEVKTIRDNMSRGWGVVLGGVTFLGIFASEVATALKKLMSQL